MLKNHHLAQAIGDVGFYEFKRQLLYKASWYGSRVILADRWEPSGKTCSSCGWLDEDLTLSDRTFHCARGSDPGPGPDAAINLEQLAGSSSDRQNACGAASLWREAKASCETGSREKQNSTLRVACPRLGKFGRTDALQVSALKPYRGQDR